LSGKERLPVELHPRQVSRYLGGVDQQHLSGDEPAGPVENFFALCKKGLAIIMCSLSKVEQSLRFHQSLRMLTVEYLCSHAAGS
jgi:hypothetical protein